MGSYQAQSRRGEASLAAGRPLIVIGITNPQTCLVMTGRLRALRQAGFRVVLIASPGALLESTARKEGVAALPIPMRRGIEPLADIVSLLRLVRALRRLRPQMTEFSTPKAGLLGSIASLLCRVPCRIYVLRGLRLETARGITRQVLTATEKIAAACSHIVLCNSPSLRSKALDLRIAGAEKLHLLGYGSSNGVDVQRFAPGPRAREAAIAWSKGEQIIGFVGRLTCDKGIPELLRAFDAVLDRQAKARLLLVGWFDESEDALDPELREWIKRHPRIWCTGFVPDTAPWYRMMDFLVLPTHREGLPNVVLEAAAAGLPVVTTTATGACDAVLPGVTGLLTPKGDPRSLTDAMMELLEDAGRRKQMGAAARRWVVEHFPQERVHARTVQWYRELVEGREGKSAALSITDAAAATD
ncbi:glycosyltransferase family 4 protein [Acidobacteria bacterium AB60]|nr:glycosyltransferase family 4 protein [Acidobacteria bacterium AB60]